MTEKQIGIMLGLTMYFCIVMGLLGGCKPKGILEVLGILFWPISMAIVMMTYSDGD